MVSFPSEVQRGADQQAHHGVGDGSDLCGVLGVGVALGVGKGVADELGQGRAVVRAGGGRGGVFIVAPRLRCRLAAVRRGGG